MTPDPRHRPWTPHEDAYLDGCCSMAAELRMAVAAVVSVAARTLHRPRAAVRARIALLQLWTREEDRC